MVGPAPEAERERDTRRLAVGFVLLVGVSSALMAAHGGASPIEIAAVGGFGLLVGAALLLALGVRP